MASSNAMTFTIPKLNNNSIQSNPIIGDDADKSKTRQQLNEFLWQKLQAKQQKTTNTPFNGIPLPKLQVNAFGYIEKPTLNIPSLQTTNTNITATPTNIDHLSTVFKRFNCSNFQCDRSQLPMKNPIDLTLALANKGKSEMSADIDRSKTAATRSSASEMLKNNIANDNFEIPFIECDRKPDSSRTALNEYCTIDITDIKLVCYLKQPSGVGRILNMQYNSRQLLETNCRDSATSIVTYKHSVKPFEFNTKSPDDRVLCNFSKRL